MHECNDADGLRSRQSGEQSGGGQWWATGKGDENTITFFSSLTAARLTRHAPAATAPRTHCCCARRMCLCLYTPLPLPFVRPATPLRAPLPPAARAALYIPALYCGYLPVSPITDVGCTPSPYAVPAAPAAYAHVFGSLHAVLRARLYHLLPFLPLPSAFDICFTLFYCSSNFPAPGAVPALPCLYRRYIPARRAFARMIAVRCFPLPPLQLCLLPAHWRNLPRC